jgi:hypothetical protein
MSLKRALATPVAKKFSNTKPNSISAQARAHGLKPHAVYSRIHRGVSLKKALTTPLRGEGDASNERTNEEELQMTDTVNFLRERARRKNLKKMYSTSYRPCPHCGGKNTGCWDDGRRIWFTTTVVDPNGWGASLYLCNDANRATSCPHWDVAKGK